MTATRAVVAAEGLAVVLPAVAQEVRATAPTQVAAAAAARTQPWHNGTHPQRPLRQCKIHLRLHLPPPRQNR